MDAVEILTKWFNFTKYNDKQVSFNIFSDDWYLHDINNKIIKFQNNFDHEAIVTVLAVKYYFNKFINNATISIKEVLTNQNNLDEIKSMYNLFNSSDLSSIEQQLITNLSIISSKLCKKNYIGEISTDKIFTICEYIVDNILNLHVEVFKKGGQINPFNNFASKILVFESVKDCLLTIENNEDSVYLCYIKNNNSVDGFFGYFIKNNGNIFSINERISEDYVGQHKRFRNNRYMENKAYELFPYDIVKFFGEDYKGYATTQEISEDKTTFDSLTEDSLNVIIITLYILYKKYVGTSLTEDVVYVNSLLDINVTPLLENNEIKSNELILLKNNNSELIKAHSQLNIQFNKEQFLNGELCKKFNLYTQSENKCQGNFNNINQEMVEAFGKDFDFENSIKSVLQTDKTKYLLTYLDKDITDVSFNNEFIGNKNQFEMEAFYEMRSQLAKHIKQKQADAYKQFGGKTKLTDWYNKLLYQKYEMLKKYCVEAYLDDNKRTIRFKNQSFGYNGDYCLFEFIKMSTKADKDEYNYISLSNNVLNYYVNPYNYYDKINCKDIDNEKESYYFFTFSFIDLKHLKEFFNTDFPDFCIGYYSDRFSCKPYTGNSILDVVDPVDELTCILNQRNYIERFSFDFSIGFSKSNFNNMLKTYKGVKCNE